jgi:hypothetical protein
VREKAVNGAGGRVTEKMLGWNGNGWRIPDDEPRTMLIRPDDPSAASWIVESLHGFAEDVGSVVPPTFKAYVRVFTPRG